MRIREDMTIREFLGAAVEDMDRALAEARRMAVAELVFSSDIRWTPKQEAELIDYLEGKHGYDRFAAGIHMERRQGRLRAAKK